MGNNLSSQINWKLLTSRESDVTWRVKLAAIKDRSMHGNLTLHFFVSSSVLGGRQPAGLPLSQAF